jgi:hypothetical protein
LPGPGSNAGLILQKTNRKNQPKNMKRNQNSTAGLCPAKHGRSLSLLATLVTTLFLGVLDGQAQTTPNGDFTDGFDNDTVGVQDSAASWTYWYNGSGTVELDNSVFKTGTGSLEVNIPFDNDGDANVGQGAWFGNFDNSYPYDSDVVYAGSDFTNIVFDILMDPSDPLSPNGDFGTLGAGLLEEGTPAGAQVDGSITIPASAATNWFHCVIPITKSGNLYLSSPGVEGVDFVYSKYSNAFLTNPVVLHIDNLDVQLGAVSNPPPIMSIKTAHPGLNFVEGSISGQYDRQNIITATANNYAWGNATPSSPVTYSFTLSNWSAPDLNFHLFLYQTSGAGGASAPDYNQPNVLIFEISPNGSGATASLTWKTNSPDSGTIGTAFTTNTVALLGTWQLEFTSATSGEIIAPGNVSYAFNVDPSLAQLIANPITLNFGINPSTDSTTILGESVVVSQISVTGVDPLSADYPTTDDFLTDSNLDTTTWTVNALYPNSILFVATNDAYEVNWTLPAIGMSLETESSLTSGSWISPAGITGTTLFPGQVTLIPGSDLPTNSMGFFRLAKLTPTQLQVLLPGESNAPGTPTGKTGSPTPAGLYDAVTFTVNEVDANYNIVSSSDTISLTSSDDEATLPTPPPALTLSSGTYSGTVYFGTTGPQTITASDDTNTNIISGTSSDITVQ